MRTASQVHYREHSISKYNLATNMREKLMYYMTQILLPSKILIGIRKVKFTQPNLNHRVEINQNL